MSILEDPHVSIVTPVYNGEPYLAECIESVLAQTYTSWDYTIVNNCSTDGTLAIAQRYARQDHRIRVHTNQNFLPIIENNNAAVRLISPDSKYCKNLSADDWLFPECIARMVELAEANPSVGLVGAYQLSGSSDKSYVRTTRGLPYSSTIISGQQIAREHLLGRLDVLGNPTSNLYRADLVRRTDSFYPNAAAEADVSACYECLRVSDFGFVHQILSYERLHLGQITNTSKSLNAYLGSKMSDLQTYGPDVLTREEMERRICELTKEYYAFLAFSALQLREKSFWSYHSERLRELRRPLNKFKLAQAIAVLLLDQLLNPKRTSGKVLRAVTARL